MLNNKTLAYSGTLHGLENSDDEYLRRFLAREALSPEESDDERAFLSPETERLMHESIDCWLERK